MKNKVGSKSQYLKDIAILQVFVIFKPRGNFHSIDNISWYFSFGIVVCAYPLMLSMRIQTP